jgi:hypothetical protein
VLRWRRAAALATPKSARTMTEPICSPAPSVQAVPKIAAVIARQPQAASVTLGFTLTMNAGSRVPLGRLVMMDVEVA